MKNLLVTTMTTALMLCTGAAAIAQETTAAAATIAIMNIDAKGMEYDGVTIAYVVRLEVDKTQKFTVIDKYEMADVFKGAAFTIDNCFSKTCLVNAGKLLNADKILSGDITRFGEKIVVTLRLVDVQSETIERSDATEYLNVKDEMQRMIEISVKRLLQIEPDPLTVSQLIDYDVPVASPKTTLRLNGPRMGASITTGETGARLRASKDDGGFDMYRTTFQFGYQQEVQYLSAGDFQALIEFVGLVGGLENGRFVPSLTMLNGFRWGRQGWEFGFGPTLRFVRKAEGFFDEEGLIGPQGEWHLANDWASNAPEDDNGDLMKNPYSLVNRLDSRGLVYGSTGLIIAAGRTFRSGYLNVPVNLYISPRKDGWIYGFSFGFNVNKKPSAEG
ncbi:MAG: hypothetical protein ACKVOR_12735 [Flavobacteriales bacterium]